MTDKARELLKQIVAWWDDDKEFIGDFVDEIRAYLAEPEVKQNDEPVATLDHNGNFKLLRMVGVTVGQPINLYERPAPQKPFVRLSEEECISIHRKWVDSGRSISRFARAIEDALEEKNK